MFVLSPVVLVSLVVIVVGCLLIWLILRSNKSRPQETTFPAPNTSAFIDTNSMPVHEDTVPVSAGNGNGGCDVVLENAGDKIVHVIKEIRGFTYIGLAEAKRLVDSAPSVILKGVSEETAAQVKGRLESVGARVTIR